MRKTRLFCLFLLVVTILSGCTNSETETASSGEPDVISVLFHQPYLDTMGITPHCSKDRKSMPKKIKSVLSEEPVAIVQEPGGLFSKDYFAVTRNASNYCYYGEVKDNKPDGFGVLSAGEIDLKQLNTLSGIIYAGEFSKGRFDGYGAKFRYKSSADTTIVDDSISSGKLDPSYRGLAEAYLRSCVVYDGYWKKGEMRGEGNIFDANIDESNPVQSGYWGGPCYPTSFFVTTAKDGQCSGSTKEYHYGFLIYDGGMKNDQRDGSGISYYYSGQKRYDGKWSRGTYHGSGKLYDENGELIYSGKWEYGDYAS